MLNLLRFLAERVKWAAGAAGAEILQAVLQKIFNKVLQKMQC